MIAWLNQWLAPVSWRMDGVSSRPQQILTDLTGRVDKAAKPADAAPAAPARAETARELQAVEDQLLAEARGLPESAQQAVGRVQGAVDRVQALLRQEPLNREALAQAVTEFRSQAKALGELLGNGNGRAPAAVPHAAVQAKADAILALARGYTSDTQEGEILQLMAEYKDNPAAMRDLLNTIKSSDQAWNYLELFKEMDSDTHRQWFLELTAPAMDAGQKAEAIQLFCDGYTNTSQERAIAELLHACPDHGARAELMAELEKRGITYERLFDELEDAPDRARLTQEFLRPEQYRSLQEQGVAIAGDARDAQCRKAATDRVAAAGQVEGITGCHRDSEAELKAATALAGSEPPADGVAGNRRLIGELDQARQLNGRRQESLKQQLAESEPALAGLTGDLARLDQQLKALDRTLAEAGLGGAARRELQQTREALQAQRDDTVAARGRLVTARTGIEADLGEVRRAGEALGVRRLEALQGLVAGVQAGADAAVQASFEPATRALGDCAVKTRAFHAATQEYEQAVERLQGAASALAELPEGAGAAARPEAEAAFAAAKEAVKAKGQARLEAVQGLADAQRAVVAQLDTLDQACHEAGQRVAAFGEDYPDPASFTNPAEAAAAQEQRGKLALDSPAEYEAAIKDERTVRLLEDTGLLDQLDGVSGEATVAISRAAEELLQEVEAEQKTRYAQICMPVPGSVGGNALQLLAARTTTFGELKHKVDAIKQEIDRDEAQLRELQGGPEVEGSKAWATRVLAEPVRPGDVAQAIARRKAELVSKVVDQEIEALTQTVSQLKRALTQVPKDQTESPGLLLVLKAEEGIRTQKRQLLDTCLEALGEKPPARAADAAAPAPPRIDDADLEKSVEAALQKLGITPPADAARPLFANDDILRQISQKTNERVAIGGNIINATLKNYFGFSDKEFDPQNPAARGVTSFDDAGLARGITLLRNQLGLPDEPPGKLTAEEMALLEKLVRNEPIDSDKSELLQAIANRQATISTFELNDHPNWDNLRQLDALIGRQGGQLTAQDLVRIARDPNASPKDRDIALRFTQRARDAQGKETDELVVNDLFKLFAGNDAQLQRDELVYMKRYLQAAGGKLPTHGLSDQRADAEKLYKALRQDAWISIGSDTNSVFAVFGGKSRAELQSLALAYKAMYGEEVDGKWVGKDLMETIRGKLSGRDLGEVLFAFKDKPIAKRVEEWSNPTLSKHLLEGSPTADKATKLLASPNWEQQIGNEFFTSPGQGEVAKGIAREYLQPGTSAERKQELLERLVVLQRQHMVEHDFAKSPEVVGEALDIVKRYDQATPPEKEALLQRFTELQQLDFAKTTLGLLDPDGWVKIGKKESDIGAGEAALMVACPIYGAGKGLAMGIDWLCDPGAFRNMDVTQVKKLMGDADQAYRAYLGASQDYEAKKKAYGDAPDRQAELAKLKETVGEQQKLFLETTAAAQQELDKQLAKEAQAGETYTERLDMAIGITKGVAVAAAATVVTLATFGAGTAASAGFITTYGGATVAGTLAGTTMRVGLELEQRYFEGAQVGPDGKPVGLGTFIWDKSQEGLKESLATSLGTVTGLGFARYGAQGAGVMAQEASRAMKVFQVGKQFAIGGAMNTLIDASGKVIQGDWHGLSLKRAAFTFATGGVQHLIGLKTSQMNVGLSLVKDTALGGGFEVAWNAATGRPLDENLVQAVVSGIIVGTVSIRGNKFIEHMEHEGGLRRAVSGLDPAEARAMRKELDVAVEQARGKPPEEALKILQKAHDQLQERIGQQRQGQPEQPAAPQAPKDAVDTSRKAPKGPTDPADAARLLFDQQVHLEAQKLTQQASDEAAKKVKVAKTPEEAIGILQQEQQALRAKLPEGSRALADGPFEAALLAQAERIDSLRQARDKAREAVRNLKPEDAIKVLQQEQGKLPAAATPEQAAAAAALFKREIHGQAQKLAQQRLDEALAYIKNTPREDPQKILEQAHHRLQQQLGGVPEVAAGAALLFAAALERVQAARAKPPQEQEPAVRKAGEEEPAAAVHEEPAAKAAPHEPAAEVPKTPELAGLRPPAAGQPVEPARLSPEAQRATQDFQSTNRLGPGERVPDGYYDGGKGQKVAGGRVTSSREVLVVDRTRDANLQRFVADAEAIGRNPALSPEQKVQAIAEYVDGLMNAGGRRSQAEAGLNSWLPGRRGQEVLLGDVPGLGGGMCRHRALLFKVLGDAAGLQVGLVRGNMAIGNGQFGGHAWNEVSLPGGRKVLVDVMNPRNGRFDTENLPTVDDPRVVAAYRDAKRNPLYGQEELPPPPREAPSVQPPPRQAPDVTEPAAPAQAQNNPVGPTRQFAPGQEVQVFRTGKAEPETFKVIHSADGQVLASNGPPVKVGLGEIALLNPELFPVGAEVKVRRSPAKEGDPPTIQGGWKIVGRDGPNFQVEMLETKQVNGKDVVVKNTKTVDAETMARLNQERIPLDRPVRTAMNVPTADAVVGVVGPDGVVAVRGALKRYTPESLTATQERAADLRTGVKTAEIEARLARIADPVEQARARDAFARVVSGAGDATIDPQNRLKRLADAADRVAGRGPVGEALAELLDLQIRREYDAMPKRGLVQDRGPASAGSQGRRALVQGVEAEVQLRVREAGGHREAAQEIAAARLLDSLGVGPKFHGPVDLGEGRVGLAFEDLGRRGADVPERRGQAINDQTIEGAKAKIRKLYEQGYKLSDLQGMVTRDGEFVLTGTGGLAKGATPADLETMLQRVEATLQGARRQYQAEVFQPGKDVKFYAKDAPAAGTMKVVGTRADGIVIVSDRPVAQVGARDLIAANGDLLGPMRLGNEATPRWTIDGVMPDGQVRLVQSKESVPQRQADGTVKMVPGGFESRLVPVADLVAANPKMFDAKSLRLPGAGPADPPRIAVAGLDAAGNVLATRGSFKGLKPDTLQEMQVRAARVEAQAQAEARLSKFVTDLSFLQAANAELDLTIPSNSTPGGIKIRGRLTRIEEDGTHVFMDRSGQQYNVFPDRLERFMAANPDLPARIEAAAARVRAQGGLRPDAKIVDLNLLGAGGVDANASLQLQKGTRLQMQDGRIGSVESVQNGKFQIRMEDGSVVSHTVSPEWLLQVYPQFLPEGTQVRVMSTDGKLQEGWVVKGFQDGKFELVRPTPDGKLGVSMRVTPGEILNCNGNLFRSDSFLARNPHLIPVDTEVRIAQGTGRVKEVNPDGTIAVELAGGRRVNVSATEVVVHNRAALLGEPPLKAVRVEAGKPFTFTSGETVPTDTYKLIVRGHAIDVRIPQGQDVRAILQTLNRHYMELPDSLLAATREVKINPSGNPHDAHWAKEYNSPNFKSAATAGGGSIDFYHGSQYLMDANIFFHEYGHNMADHFFGKTDPGKLWTDAISADKHSVSAYGNNHPQEDFAEAVAFYLQKRRAGGAEWEQWRTEHPNRAKILDDLFAGKIQPAARAAATPAANPATHAPSTNRPIWDAGPGARLPPPDQVRTALAAADQNPALDQWQQVLPARRAQFATELETLVRETNTRNPGDPVRGYVELAERIWQMTAGDPKCHQLRQGAGAYLEEVLNGAGGLRGQKLDPGELPVELLGEGSGRVTYRGQLADGTEVALKVFLTTAESGDVRPGARELFTPGGKTTYDPSKILGALREIGIAHEFAGLGPRSYGLVDLGNGRIALAEEVVSGHDTMTKNGEANPKAGAAITAATGDRLVDCYLELASRKATQRDSQGFVTEDGGFRLVDMESIKRYPNEDAALPAAVEAIRSGLGSLIDARKAYLQEHQIVGNDPILTALQERLAGFFPAAQGQLPPETLATLQQERARRAAAPPPTPPPPMAVDGTAGPTTRQPDGG